MTPAEFNANAEQIRPRLSVAAGAQLTEFQQSGLFPHEFNINSFTGAIDSDELYTEVRGALMEAAGITPTFTPTN